MAINPDQLAAEIVKAMRDYVEDIEEGIEKEKTKVANKTVQTLKATSPKKSGDYAKSWTKTKDRNGAIVVHARSPHARLTHLLEKGHAKVNGGRVPGEPHIAPAEEQAIREFEEGVRRVIEK